MDSHAQNLYHADVVSSLMRKISEQESLIKELTGALNTKMTRLSTKCDVIDHEEAEELSNEMDKLTREAAGDNDKFCKCTEPHVTSYEKLLSGDTKAAAVATESAKTSTPATGSLTFKQFLASS